MRKIKNLYRKLKIESTIDKKRFNRILYVNSNLFLFEIGNIILASLNSKFCHMFYLQDLTAKYMDIEWVDEFNYNPFNKKYNFPCYKDYSLNDINLIRGKKFKLIYDTGEGLEFDVTLETSYYEDDEEFDAKCIKAKGQSIWEDNISLFNDYFFGYLTKEELDDPELLWSLEGKKPTSFDEEVDLDEINRMIKDIKPLINECYYSDYL